MREDDVRGPLEKMVGEDDGREDGGRRRWERGWWKRTVGGTSRWSMGERIV